jgi:hypothetical protein
MYVILIQKHVLIDTYISKILILQFIVHENEFHIN